MADKKDIISAAMHSAIEVARETMNRDLGGPFGAAVLDESGEVLAVASNAVLSENDPTAHAEIVAIRAAAKQRGAHDLYGCTLVTTCYPCPMCLGATIWANIKKVVYGCRPKDAEEIGFRDDHIYEFIKGNCADAEILELEEKHRDQCLPLFEEYSHTGKTIY